MRESNLFVTYNKITEEMNPHLTNELQELEMEEEEVPSVHTGVDIDTEPREIQNPVADNNGENGHVPSLFLKDKEENEQMSEIKKNIAYEVVEGEDDRLHSIDSNREDSQNILHLESKHDMDRSINVQALRNKFTPSKLSIQLTFKQVIIRSKPKRVLCKKFPGKNILRGVSGTVLPGQFMAILGASGAGKTTLLNYLSGKMFARNLNGRGDVLYNGVKRQNINYRSLTAYVMQDDILFDSLTVRECLQFSANLRIPASAKERLRRVNYLIDELGLTKCQNTRIGGALTRGVSGGERKRTSIGVELITDPSLIFLDQPTTGLDSYTAQTVVQILRSLALSGRTVIATIHQPNSDTFAYFDKLMLLSHGEIIYMNKASKSIDYFTSIGFECPEETNPADYFMKIMSAETFKENIDNSCSQEDDPQQKYLERVEYFIQKYQKSDLKCDHTTEATQISDLRNAKIRKGSQTNCCIQFGLLLQRSARIQLRTPQSSYVKLFVITINALLTCLLYFDIGFDFVDIQNRNGAVFFVSVSICFGSIQNNILMFPGQKAIFLREQSNSMYRVCTYYLGKIIAELPMAIIVPCLFNIVSYFLIGFNSGSDNVGLSFLILIMAYNTAGAFSLLISALIKNKEVAVSLLPILVVPFMLFSGYFVNQSNIPEWLIPFEYISVFKFGFQAFIINEYDGINHKFNCNQPPCADPVGFLNLSENLTESMLIMLGLYLGFNFLSYMILFCQSKRNQ